VSSWVYEIKSWPSSVTVQLIELWFYNTILSCENTVAEATNSSVRMNDFSIKFFIVFWFDYANVGVKCLVVKLLMLNFQLINLG